MALLNRYIPPEGRGLLNAIAGPESGGAYDVIYGGRHIDDLSHHPHIAVPIASGPNKGKTSSAAGKYQFLGDTWDDIAGRYGLQDFSPANQDYGAWALANEVYRKKTGGDLTEALRAGKLPEVAQTLSGTWTSLAGGIEAQPQGQGRGLLANYQTGMGQIAGSEPVLASDSFEPVADMASQPNTEPDEGTVYDQAAMRGLLAQMVPAEQEQPENPRMRLAAAEPMSPPPRPRGLAFKQTTVRTSPKFNMRKI